MWKFVSSYAFIINFWIQIKIQKIKQFNFIYYKLFLKIFGILLSF